VSNTSVALIEWLHETFGGQVDPVDNEGTTCKDVYHWNLVDVQTIFYICENVLPFLIIKKHQAELVLQFPFDVKCNQYTPELTKNVYEKKLALYEMTLQLNKRGRL
jgi:hypothetical protein